METLDHQAARRVWDRVQQKTSPPQTPELAALLTGLRQEAALYAHLLKGKNRTGFQPLWNQVNRHIASIQGMCLLSGIQTERFSPPPPPPEPLQSTLRRAYSNALGRLTEYEKRTSDAAFGPVFHTLAEETRTALRSLTEICGLM